MSTPGVNLRIQDHHVVMDNGIVRVIISKPAGQLTGIQSYGIDNLLEVRNKENDRGYWDLVWNKAGSAGTTGIDEPIEGTSFKVIVENEEQVEISFTKPWDPSLEGKSVPLNIDKRYVMLRSSSGFYAYAIYEHLPEWPAFNLPQTRIVFRIRKDKFQYMVIADNRQRHMPLPDDRLPKRCKPLDWPEAVILTNPVEPEFKGEVDDKYQYSCENKELKVHGWICNDPPVGFWQITPSNEFRSGGLLKQNLTSHVGPITLAMFLSAHYAGEDLVLKLNPGEPWKKVFGPVFMYINSLSEDSGSTTDPHTWLWEDAKRQTLVEEQSWPYSFPASDDFPKGKQRGRVSGKLQIRDRFVNDEGIPAKHAYVGLAPPGDAGSWQRECKGYQFWTTTDENGSFSINNIRTGDYNLYAWVPGFIGDYRNDTVITITEGCDIGMGNLVFEPPRDGPTIWEIGIPDRSAAEFYVPDPNPTYINKLYVNHPDKFRQYGLWERYTELYPEEDLVYTVDVSDYKKDWFFAQVTRFWLLRHLSQHIPSQYLKLSKLNLYRCRKKADNTYTATTWQIKFTLANVDRSGTYKLRLALATANLAKLQVRVNNRDAEPPLFTTGEIGHDNAIARHGIHGLYRLYNVDVPGSRLMVGDNTIFLTQAISTNAFEGVMYDYLRLEGPPSSSSNNKL